MYERVHHSDYLIKSIRLDNTREFTSKIIAHPLEMLNTQDGLVDIILVMRTTESSFYVGLCNRACNNIGPVEAYCYPYLIVLQLVTWYELDASHLRVYGYAVLVPIVPSQRTNWVLNKG